MSSKNFIQTAKGSTVQSAEELPLLRFRADMTFTHLSTSQGFLTNLRLVAVRLWTGFLIKRDKLR